MVRRKKRNPMKDFKYGDNLGHKELNIGPIADDLLDLIGEDLAKQLINLNSSNEPEEMLRVLDREMNHCQQQERADTPCSTPRTRMKRS